MSDDTLLATTWFDGVQYVWLSDHMNIVAELRAEITRLRAQVAAPALPDSFNWADVNAREIVVTAFDGAAPPAASAAEPVAYVKPESIATLTQTTFNAIDTTLWKKPIAGATLALYAASPSVAPQDERAAFEKWLLKHWDIATIERGVDDEYIVRVTQENWLGWRARAALSPDSGGK